MADRWECSQASGLPAWRHQDLSTSQPLGHTVSQALKQKNLYLGTRSGWTLCKSMYTATQGAFAFRFVSLQGKNSPYLGDGLTKLNIQMHISWGGRKISKKRGKFACKHTLDRAPNHAPVRIRHM